VRQARAEFAAFVTARGVAGVPTGYLTVVVVPSRVFCDRRLYESADAFAGCESRESHYRVRERTLYVADNERRLRTNLRAEIALQMCVDADVPSQAPCADAFEAFVSQEK
jgi:hypothetical protein